MSGASFPSQTQESSARSMVIDGGFALGLAVVLTLCDAWAHVASGVLSYTEADSWSLFAGQPTLQVFAGFLLFAVLLAAGLRVFLADYPKLGGRQTVVLVVVFLGCYALSGVLRAWPMLLFAGFLLLWAWQLNWFTTGVHRVVGLSVTLAVVGPVVEGSYSATGFFHYADPAVFGVPAWLAPLYLNGALAALAAHAWVHARWRVRHSGHPGT